VYAARVVRNPVAIADVKAVAPKVRERRLEMERPTRVEQVGRSSQILEVAEATEEAGGHGLGQGAIKGRKKGRLGSAESHSAGMGYGAEVDGGNIIAVSFISGAEEGGEEAGESAAVAFHLDTHGWRDGLGVRVARENGQGGTDNRRHDDTGVHSVVCHGAVKRGLVETAVLRTRAATLQVSEVSVFNEVTTTTLDMRGNMHLDQRNRSERYSYTGN
jgi:hypothetical protein